VGTYEEAVRRGRRGGGEERRLAEGELVGGRREQEVPEVDGEQVGAVAASHGDGGVEAAAGHADLEK
jgi:hypothetical protein